MTNVDQLATQHFCARFKKAWKLTELDRYYILSEKRVWFIEIDHPDKTASLFSAISTFPRPFYHKDTLFPILQAGVFFAKIWKSQETALERGCNFSCFSKDIDVSPDY